MPAKIGELWLETQVTDSFLFVSIHTRTSRKGHIRTLYLTNDCILYYWTNLIFVLRVYRRYHRRIMDPNTHLHLFSIWHFVRVLYTLVTGKLYASRICKFHVLMTTLYYARCLFSVFELDTIDEIWLKIHITVSFLYTNNLRSSGNIWKFYIWKEWSTIRGIRCVFTYSCMRDLTGERRPQTRISRVLMYCKPVHTLIFSAYL